MSKQLVLAQRWVKDYFLEHPDASVDVAARDARRSNIGLHKSDIARIRREVRVTIGSNGATNGVNGHAKVPPRGNPVCHQPRRRTPKEPFNPPRVKLHGDPEAEMSADEVAAMEKSQQAGSPAVAEKPSEVEKLDVAPVDEGKMSPASTATDTTPTTTDDRVESQQKLELPTENQDMTGQARAKKALAELKSSDDKKIAWAATQAEKNPKETTLALNRRIAEKFGMGYPMPKLGEITRIAREATGTPMKPTRTRKPKAPAPDGVTSTPMTGRGRPKKQSPIDGEIKSLVRASRINGLYGVLRINQDGSYEFDLKQVTTTGFSGRGTA